MEFKIFLAGSVPKGDDESKNWVDWKVLYKEKLSKIYDFKFIYGDIWQDRTRPSELFGHDVYLIKSSDIVIVNGETRLGIGTSQEMVIAKYFSKPVITILPKGTYQRRSNIVFNGKLIQDWIHPFVLALSDLIVEKIDDSTDWLKEFIKDSSSKEIKNIKIIDELINVYLKSK